MTQEFGTLAPIQFSESGSRALRMEDVVQVQPSNFSKFHSLETEPEENPPSAFIPSVDASVSAFMPPRLEKSVSGGTATMSAASSFMSFGEEDTTLDGSKSSFSSATSFNLDFGARQRAHRCTLGSADEVSVLPLSDEGSQYDSHFEDSHECFGRRVESELAKMDAIHMCGDAGGPHEYVMGTGSGAIKFSVQYFIDMGRRCSLDSITASCMVLRVCPLSSSLDESTTNELFASMIHGPLVAAVRKNCIAHPASMLDF